MINKIKKIIKELNLYKNVYKIEKSINRNMFYSEIYKIYFKNHGDYVDIILKAYSKKDFLKNNYDDVIKKQILQQKMYFED